MNKFELVSEYKPTGDQPQAIESLCQGIEDGERLVVLMGITGSGKTFTMANVIERLQRPTLVIAHNKTLAAQLCSELKEFFPNSAVEYFVSYYDYYQPEAYIPSSDTYIEKTATINEEIDLLRHSATCSLNERRDVIIVASVSCIYALGNPEEYLRLSISLRRGMQISREDVMKRLVEIQYQRNEIDFSRGTFRAKGDVLDIFASNMRDKFIRVEFFGDEIDRISEVSAVTGDPEREMSHYVVFPATHYATGRDKLQGALNAIEKDLYERIRELNEKGDILEAKRLEQRTQFDMEMMREIGYCQGIENYSRYFDGRIPGEPPFTLLDYFPKDYLMIIDESHVTLPQIRAMYRGDRARKESLVQYGFRLPSAFDNRPLKFDEFEDRINQLMCVSATPAEFELSHASRVAEQIIRPTGLVDPEIVVHPIMGQVDDLYGQISATVEKGMRVLVTTLTKRMAEMLTEHFDSMGVRVRYMHSEIETTERMEIIRDLRLGEFDVLVGINLLREGLDLPEVGLVAILDADKEGFLRSSTSLIQTIGRAARNAEGHVIMYADTMTDSMKNAIEETARRRKIQMAYNEEHGITPTTIKKAVRDLISISKTIAKEEMTFEKDPESMSREELEKLIGKVQKEMKKAAADLNFEAAAELRDKMVELKKYLEKIDE